MNLDTLQAFEGEVRKVIPKFRVGFKDQSWFMKLLGFFARPFNPQFMERYTTTFYPVVYFPTKADYESQPKPSLTVLAHELVHLLDTKDRPLWFRLSYALPQALSPLAFLAFVIAAQMKAWPLAILLVGYVIGCFFAKISQAAFWIVFALTFAATSTLIVLLCGWLAIPYFLGVILLAPWPSTARTHWELRGYTMSLAVLAWTFGPPPTIIRELTVKHFIGPDYYFMSWSRKNVADVLTAGIMRAQNGTLKDEQPYGIVYDFLSAHGEIRK